MGTYDTTLQERDGIAEIRSFVNEFLKSGEGSENVREYISSVTQDDTLIRIYLKGRKCRTNYAWETLKCNAEVRFDKYPEVFPTERVDVIGQLKKYGVVGILKARDKLGRRIILLNAEKWDPVETSSEQMTIMGLYLLERGLRDDDMLTNGFIYIQNCSGMGMKHAKLYTLHKMLRIVNICWYSYPLKVKGIYYVNVPIYLAYLYNLVKSFLTTKFKQRLKLSTKDNRFETLHENISPDLLPKCLGGILEDQDAFDWEFLQPKQ